MYRVNRPINKDTEMHPLVRWQFRGLGEDQRRAFYFEQIYDAKGKQYDMPVLIGGLAGSQRIYALGLDCREDEVEEIWAKALENPIEPVLVKQGEVQERSVYRRGADPHAEVSINCRFRFPLRGSTTLRI